MKSLVINKYIDNKIDRELLENKDLKEIIASLEERIVKTESMTNKYKGYIIFFAKKRICDLIFVKENFSKVPNKNLVNLMKLKDKLDGFEFQDADIRDKSNCSFEEYEPLVTAESSRPIF